MMMQMMSINRILNASKSFSPGVALIFMAILFLPFLEHGDVADLPAQGVGAYQEDDVDYRVKQADSGTEAPAALQQALAVNIGGDDIRDLIGKMPGIVTWIACWNRVAPSMRAASYSS